MSDIKNVRTFIFEFKDGTELRLVEKENYDKLVEKIKELEEENYIPKQKVLKEVDKLLNAFRKIEFNKVTIWNSLIQLKENLLEDK